MSFNSFGMSCADMVTPVERKVLSAEESFVLEVYAAAAFATIKSEAHDVLGIIKMRGSFDKMMESIKALPNFRREALVEKISEQLLRQLFYTEKPFSFETLLPADVFYSAYDKLSAKNLFERYIRENLDAILLNGAIMHAKADWKKVLLKPLSNRLQIALASSAGAGLVVTLSNAGLDTGSLGVYGALTALQYVGGKALVNGSKPLKPIYNSFDDLDARGQNYIEGLGGGVRAEYTRKPND